MKSDGGPAFPIPESNIVRDGYQSISIGAKGMSLRDWFAGQAIYGIIPNPESDDESVEELARGAYRMADAMLAERNKNSS